MIRNSFCILNGIGQKLERRLWSEGVLTWDDFLVAEAVGFISPGRKRLMDDSLCLHREKLEYRDSSWLGQNIRGCEHWRLHSIFREHSVCLDIETNGYQPGAGGYVTMVGLYDGFDYRCLVRGENLSAETLARALAPYKYLVTFYGSVFDVPYLKRALPGFDLNVPHFDLCFGAKKTGLKGGLKRIEAELGIERVEETRGMDGFDAVILWNEHRRGNPRALELLAKYNREDTVNLWSIADTIYSRLRECTGFDRYAQSRPAPALN
ncbi:MAG: ribonuclease H-like domain-containing protein [Nitrospirota bacterium]|jgi:uncharacterized protein YprB with RNaseH-like and TPR domain